MLQKNPLWRDGNGGVRKGSFLRPQFPGLLVRRIVDKITPLVPDARAYEIPPSCICLHNPVFLAYER